MKLTKITTMMTGAFLSMGIHANSGYQELSKELEVMTSVLNTTLKQETESQAIRFRSMGLHYLADQGVVFNVNTSGSRRWTGNFDKIFFAGSNAPSSNITISDGQVFDIAPDVEVEVHEVLNEALEGVKNIEIHQVVEEAMEGVKFAFDINRSELREIRNAQRELSWEERDIERRKRDLEFEIRNTEKEREQQVREELKQIEKELADIRVKREEIAEKSKKIEMEKKDALEKRQQATAKAKKSFLAAFEEGVADSLCRFGGGLRSIPSDQNISFILDEFNSESDAQDKVYVFKMSDVKRCVQEKIDEKELLAKASVYDF